MENKKIQNSDFSGRHYSQAEMVDESPSPDIDDSILFEARQHIAQVYKDSKKPATSKLRTLAMMAALATAPMPSYQYRDWSSTSHDRPQPGVKQRRAKAKATRKAKQMQRRKGKG